MPRRLTFTLHELVATMDGYADSVLTQGFGVSMSDFRYLGAVAEAPADMTELAGRLLLTRAAVSKRVPVLVARGWVRTESTPDDRRRTIVRLTPEGGRLVQQAGDVLEGAFARLFVTPRAVGAGLDAAELDVHLRLLTDLIREKNA